MIATMNQKRGFGMKITNQTNSTLNNSKFNFAGITTVQQIYFGNYKTDFFVIDSGVSCHVANDLKTDD